MDKAYNPYTHEFIEVPELPITPVSDIKPCPFCGGKAKWSVRDMHDREWSRSEKCFKKKFSVQVICNKCHGRGKPVRFYSGKWGNFWDVPYLEQKADIVPWINLSIAYWNRRDGFETD